MGRHATFTHALSILMHDFHSNCSLTHQLSWGRQKYYVCRWSDKKLADFLASMKQVPQDSSLLIFSSTTLPFSKAHGQQIFFTFTQQIQLNMFPTVLCTDMLQQENLFETNLTLILQPSWVTIDCFPSGKGLTAAVLFPQDTTGTSENNCKLLQLPHLGDTLKLFGLPHLWVLSFISIVC